MIRLGKLIDLSNLYRLAHIAGYEPSISYDRCVELIGNNYISDYAVGIYFSTSSDDSYFAITLDNTKSEKDEVILINFKR